MPNNRFQVDILYPNNEADKDEIIDYINKASPNFVARYMTEPLDSNQKRAWNPVHFILKISEIFPKAMFLIKFKGAWGVGEISIRNGMKEDIDWNPPDLGFLEDFAKPALEKKLNELEYRIKKELGRIKNDEVLISHRKDKVAAWEKEAEKLEDELEGEL